MGYIVCMLSGTGMDGIVFCVSCLALIVVCASLWLLMVENGGCPTALVVDQVISCSMSSSAEIIAFPMTVDNEASTRFI